MVIYTHRNGKQHMEDKAMTRAEKKAIEARAKDLIKAGVDRELAKVMAKAEFDCGLIRPVVNGN